jgi:hypothetical protein
VAVGSKLHAKGLVHPGSAHAVVWPTKSKKAPRTHVNRLEAEKDAMRDLQGREGRESRWKKQSMCSSFVFELDKIRKITNEVVFFSNECLNNPDERLFGGCVCKHVATEKPPDFGWLFI